MKNKKKKKIRGNRINLAGNVFVEVKREEGENACGK